MEIFFAILKSMLIGVLGSIPVGPIVVFTLQRSISGGRKAGMACAAGGIITDSLFAIIAVFAFNTISEFLEVNTGTFKIIGGAIIAIVGISMFFSKVGKMEYKVSKSRIAIDTTKSVLMGLSNPGYFLWIIAMFAAFHIAPQNMPRYVSGIIVISVAAGSMLYWLFFTAIAAKGKKHLSVNTLMKINRISGIFVVLFGLYFLLSGLNMTIHFTEFPL